MAGGARVFPTTCALLTMKHSTKNSLEKRGFGSCPLFLGENLVD